MQGCTIRGLLMAIPVMGIVALIVFSLLYLTPGDPAMVLAGDQASQEQIEKIRAALGLDRPPHVRFVARLWQMANGDLGPAIFSGEPGAHKIEQRLEPPFSPLALSVLPPAPGRRPLRAA